MESSLPDFAARIAPQLDRLRLGVMRAAVEVGMRSGLLGRIELDRETLTVFAMLRNAWPDRAVPLAAYRAAYVYQEPGTFDAALARMVAALLVTEDPPSHVRLTDPGRELMARVRGFNAEAAEGLWGTGPLPVLALADRCLGAAAASAVPDGAFHLVAPPHDEPDDSDATRLAERLTGLRWHRFDAHVAAWSAVGLTASSVSDLPAGPERTRLEEDTDQRASEAYSVLDPSERIALLDGLEQLT